MTTRAADVAGLVREIEHTADLGFEVEAPTLPLLFERAGTALLAVIADLGTVAPREERAVAVAGTVVDDLLHDWLQALLVEAQAAGFLPCELEVDALDDRGVRGAARGERIDPARHRIHTEVKGVTYHQLAVVRTDRGWRARVILDV